MGIAVLAGTMLSRPTYTLSSMVVVCAALAGLTDESTGKALPSSSLPVLCVAPYPPGAMQLRGGGKDCSAERAAETARDVAKAAALLQKARAGFAAAGVQPPDKIAQIDELSRLLNDDKAALVEGDLSAHDRLKRTVGTWDKTMGAAVASVVDSDEDREDWEAEVDKLKEEGDALEQEIRTGVRRGSEYNQWDEIPALRKAELMISEDSHYPLWKAVRDANADRLRYLLQSRTDLNVNHEFSALWNSSLLHVAAEGEDVEVLTLLVISGAAIEQRNAYSQAPLHLASYWGNVEMIRRLLDMGADIEVRSSDASTPLHIAAFYGQNETVKELVGLGASLTSVPARHTRRQAATHTENTLACIHTQTKDAKTQRHTDSDSRTDTHASGTYSLIQTRARARLMTRKTYKQDYMPTIDGPSPARPAASLPSSSPSSSVMTPCHCRARRRSM
jgi:hypothetical protein